MSKSVTRVRAALDAAGSAAEIRRMSDGTRTAQEAADALGVAVDQIAKSVIFRDPAADTALLFITAGGNRVDAARAADLAGGPLDRAEAGFVRARTGFVIGGVAPVGHLSPPRAWFDPRLMDFDVIWAAAGTPHHVFPIAPADLQRMSGAQVADFTS